MYRHQIREVWLVSTKQHFLPTMIPWPRTLDLACACDPRISYLMSRDNTSAILCTPSGVLVTSVAFPLWDSAQMVLRFLVPHCHIWTSSQGSPHILERRQDERQRPKQAQGKKKQAIMQGRKEKFRGKQKYPQNDKKRHWISESKRCYKKGTKNKNNNNKTLRN